MVDPPQAERVQKLAPPPTKPVQREASRSPPRRSPVRVAMVVGFVVGLVVGALAQAGLTSWLHDEAGSNEIAQRAEPEAAASPPPARRGRAALSTPTTPAARDPEASSVGDGTAAVPENGSATTTIPAVPIEPASSVATTPSSPPAGLPADVAVAKVPGDASTAPTIPAVPIEPAPTVATTPSSPQAASAGMAVAEVDAEFRIQLAALDSEASVHAMWDDFVKEFGPLVEGLERYVVSVRSTNGALYLVQMGPFQDLQPAQAKCDQLKGRDVTCIVVRRLRQTRAPGRQVSG